MQLPITPGLKSGIHLFAGRRLGIRKRTAREPKGGAAWSDGSSAGAARQAEIDQHSWELAMRQVSDNAHLSDTAAQQLAGARQRDRRKESACG